MRGGHRELLNAKYKSSQQRTHSAASPVPTDSLLRWRTRPLASGLAVSLASNRLSADIFRIAVWSRRLLISTSGPHGPDSPPLSSGSFSLSRLKSRARQARGLPTLRRHPCLGGTPPTRDTSSLHAVCYSAPDAHDNCIFIRNKAGEPVQSSPWRLVQEARLIPPALCTASVQTLGACTIILPFS